MRVRQEQEKHHARIDAPCPDGRSYRPCGDAWCGGRRLADTHHHDHAWVSAGRPLGRRRPHHRRRAEQGARPVGHRRVAHAAPDGYTLLNIPSGHPTAAVTFAKLPFRPVADFSMITLASTYSYVMSVPSATGIKSVAELIEAARRRATPLVYGTPGTGSGPHLAIELFALTTKIKVQHVPFRGSAPAVTELIAGRLDFMMDPPATMMQFIRDGRLRALAVSSAKRYFALPDTPTLAEAGVPGFDVTGWQGLIGPAGLPAPIVDRLNREVTRILLEPAAVEQLHAFGNEPAPCSPDEFKKRIESDIAKWTGVVEQIHFQKI